MLWHLVQDDLQRMGRQQITRGKIVDIHSSFADTWTYTAVVRFETEDGQIIDFVDDYSGSRRPILGREVTVSYPTGQPSLARIPRPLFRLFAYVITTGLAMVMVALLTGAVPA